MEGNQDTEAPKPKTNGRRQHWSALELEEWKKKTGEAFDELAHLDDVKRFEKEHGIEQTPKPKNEYERLVRLDDDLDKAVRVREGEVAAHGQEPLGFGPPVDVSPKPPEPKPPET